MGTFDRLKEFESPLSMKFEANGRPNIYWVIDRIRRWWGRTATWEGELDHEFYDANPEMQGLERFKNKYFKVGYKYGKFCNETRFCSDNSVYWDSRHMWYGDPENLKDAVDKAEAANKMEHWRFDSPMWWFRYRDRVGD